MSERVKGSLKRCFSSVNDAGYAPEISFTKNGMIEKPTIYYCDESLLEE